eukprot:gene8285-11215_t
MDLNSLKSQRYLPPQLSHSDRRVQSILRDLDKIKRTKPNTQKQYQLGENLIYYVVQSIRHYLSDHLLQTTAIWTLINIFRISPTIFKKIMLRAGVASVLYEILSANLLAGATRQYASELCFYLSTDHVYPDANKVPQSGPLVDYPIISAENRFEYNTQDNASSASSDLTTIVDDPDRKRAFKPYRLDETNLRKLDTLFTDAPEYSHLYQPNPVFLSSYGFSDKLFNQDDDDSYENDDKESVESSVSSRSLRSARSDDSRIDGGSIKSQFSINSFYSNDINFHKKSYTLNNNNVNSTGNNRPHTTDYQKSRAKPTPKLLDRQQNNEVSELSGMNTSSFELKMQKSSTVSFSDVAHQRSIAYSPQSSMIRLHTTGSQNIGSTAFETRDTFTSSKSNQSKYPINNNSLLEINNNNYRPKTVSNEYTRNNHFKIGGQSSRLFHATRLEDDDSVNSGNSHEFFPNDTIASPTPMTQSMLIGFHDSVDTNQLPSKENDNNIKSKAKHHMHSMSVSLGAMQSVREAQKQLTNEKLSNFGVTEFLAQLDPLALSESVNINKMKRFDTMSIDSQLAEEYDEDMVIPDVDADDLNDGAENIIKRQKIRAERLVDHEFTKRLFIKKATTADAQSLVARMETLLVMMDPERTGYVTWEKFARILIALAPQHLVRSDILGFISAQSDNDQNLIDYNEFIISGKVMIIEKELDPVAKLPIKGWLERQKLFTGQTSTYTWKNHVQWYQTRKANALIWLMRRASISLNYAMVLERAYKYLKYKAIQGKALTYLIEVGYEALVAQERRLTAKKNLLKRCIHARKWAQTTEIAQRFLKYTAQGVINQLKYEDEIKALKEKLKKEIVLFPEKKKQANYSSLFKVSQLQKLTVNYLKEKSRFALNHCATQDIAFQFLFETAKRVQIQFIRKEEARDWLLYIAAKALRHCSIQDFALDSLTKTGTRAFLIWKRLENDFAWLKNESNRAKLHNAKQDEVLESLVTFGQFKLKYMNAREDGITYLLKRGRRLKNHLVRVKESFEYLKKCPLALWKMEDDWIKTQAWLAHRGKLAIALIERKVAAFRVLQFIGARATIVMRNITIAHADLIQIGQLARMERWKIIWAPMPTSKDRITLERRLLLLQDTKNENERSKLSQKDRWKIELQDAFELIATSLTHPNNELVYKKKYLLGRVGFRRLMMNGRLLGISPENVEEQFAAVDPATNNFVKFEAVWTWFYFRALKRDKFLQKQKNKHFFFKSSNILSIDERVMMIMLREYGMDLLSEPIIIPKFKKKGKGNLFDDDEEDEDESSLQDTEFSGANLHNAEIGALMRYVTRQNIEYMFEKKIEENENDPNNDFKNDDTISLLKDDEDATGMNGISAVIDDPQHDNNIENPIESIVASKENI